LSTQVPDRECDFRVPNRDGLLHEIDTYCAYISDSGVRQIARLSPNV
jgi:hypothetical protein